MATIDIWTNDPTILFNNKYLSELWPSQDMSYEQKINAITRLIILVTILGYILTRSNKIVFTGVITLIVIFALYKMRKHNLDEGFQVEGNEVTGLFDNNKTNIITNPVTLESVVRSEFTEGTKKNPFSNVLLTDIMDTPNRESAPPSFNPQIEEDITKNVKKSVQFMNPGIKNTNKQLFGDLWNNFELDQSNRLFYSTANTRVANDQGAFAQYLYSDLKYSGKESTPEGAIARVQDNYRYTLY
jgi:hypothetical protein